MVNVGGFFASLKLMTDEDSFKKGVGILEGFPKLLGKAAMGAVGLGVAFVGLGASTANAMTKLAATAKQLGMNAMTLDNWQNAVRLAGGDADSFTSSIQTMNEAFRNLKIGEVKEDFIKATGMSGADFSKLQGMNNDQRLRTIWSALEKVQDPGKQQALIQKIFGQGGVDLFSRMQLQGTNLGALYSQAAGMNPNTQADYDAAVKGNKANESIMVSFDNTIKKLGIEIEKALLPSLTQFSQWLIDNKKGLSDFAVSVGNVTTVLVGLINSIGTVIGNITGWFSDNEKKQKYLDSRKVYSGLGKTNAELGLLYGTGPENEYYKKYASGELTLDQINKIDSSATRFNLFKSGQTQLAASLSDNAIKVIANRASSMAKSLYPGANLSEQDSRVANLETSLVGQTERTLNVKISSDGKLTDSQVKTISDAILASNTMPVRQ